MPATAAEPCALPVLGERARTADLEIAYVERGAALVACDAARALAVDVHAAEHADQDRWLASVERRRLPWWRRLVEGATAPSSSEPKRGER